MKIATTSKRRALWWLGKPTTWVWLSQQPIVVLPLAFTCLGLVMLPVAMYGTEKAAQFYGAFFGAVATLIAVVLGGLLTAALTRQRDDLQRQQAVIASARMVAAEVDSLRVTLNRQRGSRPSPQVFFCFLGGGNRSLAQRGANLELRKPATILSNTGSDTSALGT